ncbi:MAG: hypothetical protein ACHQAX_07710 [Gammaproteobacteria bacterium]
MIGVESLINIVVDVRRHPLSVLPPHQRLDADQLAKAILKLIYPANAGIDYVDYIKHHPNDFKDEKEYLEFWNNKKIGMKEQLSRVVGNIDIPDNLNKIYTETNRIARENIAHRICVQKWSTIGDLHGSSLKFLFFLLLQGAITLEDDNAYEDFYELYQESFKYTSCATTLVTDILPYISVTPKALIRLIGDETGDRCGNDYFILKLIEIVVDGGAQIEILISNHGIELVKAMEAVINDHALENINLPPYQEQYASTHRLKGLIIDGVVTLDEVKQLYEKYKKTLKAFSYDYNDAGQLMIYAHAPMNELDILDIAQHLINRQTQGEVIMRQESYHSLSSLVERLNKHNEMLQPEDVILLIDQINSIVQNNAAQNTLTHLVPPLKILNEKLSKKEIDITTHGDIRNGKNVDPLIYGLHYTTHNRDNPNTGVAAQRRAGTRPKNPDIIMGHGHDDAKHEYCVCYDNMLCKNQNINVGILNISVSNPNKPEPKNTNRNVKI